jgi:hypothetical protein
MDESALACDLFALSPPQRRRHAMLVAQLAHAVERVQELPNGYEYSYPSNTAVWSALAEWVDLERRCCPFLSFTIQIVPHTPLLLRITGPDGIKLLLKHELSQLAQ